MSYIKAISQSSSQVGKKMAQTKKKFKWIFTIDQDRYQLQLISSLLSGKKVIKLNQQQIYTQKDILNTKFDFSYNIKGHTIRVKRTNTSMNLFEVFIDNYSFLDILDGNTYETVKKITDNQNLNKKRKEDNPFQEFNKISLNKINNVESSNDSSKVDKGKSLSQFQNFNFDDFTNQMKKISNSPKKQQQSSELKRKSYEDDQKPKLSYNDQNDQFVKKFTQSEKQIINEQDFATNAYLNINNFAGLHKNQQKKISPHKKQKIQQIQMLTQQAKNKIQDFMDLWKKT